MENFRLHITAAQNLGEAEDPRNGKENELLLVVTPSAYCLDIEATGKRVVPILRKIETTLTAAGLAGQAGIFAGWFGQWAEDLTDRSQRKYFLWNYSGEEDRRRGVWSYSWGIEDHEGSWYIFLNLARPETTEKTAPTMEAATLTLDRVQAALDSRKDRSAWNKGVTVYASELLEGLRESIEGGYFDPEDLAAPKLLNRELLNGASDWNQYSWGGSSLIYDGDIARRLCSPSELRRTREGERRPNAREEWLDTRARALFQAAHRLTRTIRENL